MVKYLGVYKEVNVYEKNGKFLINLTEFNGLKYDSIDQVKRAIDNYLS